MRNHRRRGLTALATVASLVSLSALAACGGDGDDEGENDGKVKITVEGWRPGDEQGTIDAVKKQAQAFMDDNPDIVVEPVEWEWTAETFATQLAGDQLPTTFRVPFTDAKGLAERQQIADVTEYVEALPYADEFNPSVLEAAKGTDGQIYGLPTDVYGVGLHYNRALFEEAGLDPDAPPTSWDEVRQFAKQIADKTGQAGYVQMSANNTGGWMLTTLTYSLGGRMQSDDGTEAMVDNDATRAGLQMLHDMRWSDESMGKNTQFEWGTVNEAFAAGKVGMYMSGSDVYNALVTTNQVDPASYGLAVLPLGDSGDAGILGGGSVAAVNAKASAAEQEAAVQWNDFYREKKNYDPDAAVADAEGARRERPADRHADAADLRRGDMAGGAGRDRAVHQRAPRADDVLHRRGVRPAARPRAPLAHAGGLRHPRLRGAEGAHRRERRHRRRARRRQRAGPGAARLLVTRREMRADRGLSACIARRRSEGLPGVS